MIGIYLIKNNITNEVYIGQSKNIERRWTNHKNNVGKSKYNLYSDISFYGLSNFDFSVIEECDISALDSREMYWIKKYQEDGYSLYNINGVPEREAVRSARFKRKRTSKKYRT